MPEQERGGVGIYTVIYGDVFMIINFSMDFLSLYVTSKLLSSPPKTKRLCAAAVLGALYSLAALFLPPSAFLPLMFGIAVAVLMCVVAFGKKLLLKSSFVFYAVNFLLGGGITALSNLLRLRKNSAKLSIGGSFEVLNGDLPVEALFIGAALCGIIAYAAGKTFKKSAVKRTASLKILLGDREVSVTGLVDTGCSLCDPVTGKDVIPVKFEAVRDVLPVGCLAFFRSGGNDTSAFTDKIAFPVRLRMIPAKGIGNGTLLPGFVADRTLIDGTETDCVLAVDVSGGTFGGNGALIPPTLL